VSDRKWTDEQLIEALRQTGGNASAAVRALGCGGSVHQRMARLRSRAIPPALPALPDGFDVASVSTQLDADGETCAQSVRARPHVEPAADTVPDGHIVSGVSTLIGPNGVAAQWVKTRGDKDRSLQAWIDAAPAVLERVVPGIRDTEPAPPPEGALDDDRCVGYVIGDAHIGMLCWAPETGANWDVKIAEGVMREAIDYLFATTPRTRECLIVNVGDLQHADSPTNATPEGGNRLDVDGRDQRVRRAVIRVLRYYIERALAKHERVTFVNQPGNHDPYATSWLGLLLATAFEREPRVEIDTSPAPWRAHQFGRNMIAITHKPQQGEDIGHQMAALWPEMWGATEHRVCLAGHVHHQSRKERPGFEVETFGILAPRDAWHAGRGYLAKRRMTAIVWHREHGEDSRATFHVSRSRVAT
jgi:hypothetical protein